MQRTGHVLSTRSPHGRIPPPPLPPPSISARLFPCGIGSELTPSISPLPLGWNLQSHPTFLSRPPRQYTYTPTGESSPLHPCIDYYRGAVFMDSGGYRQLLRNMEARPPAQEEVRRR